MNIQISIINEVEGVFRTHKFDKRRNLPFQYSQFLQFKSNRSVSQSYNIIQSQAFPILYLSNNVHDVLSELEFLMEVLTANGFRRQKLKNRLIKFLRLGSFPALKFDLSEVLHILERWVYITKRLNQLVPNFLYRTFYVLQRSIDCYPLQNK